MIQHTDTHPLPSAGVGDGTQSGIAQPSRQHLDLQLLIKAQEMVHVGTWVANIRGEEPGVKDEVLWSDEMYRMFGMEPRSQRVSFETFKSAIHPDDRARVGAIIQRGVAERMPFRFDYRVNTPDGRLKVHHSRATFEFNDRDEIVRVLGTASDITERYRAQQSLAESEARLRAVFEQAAVGMAVGDADGTFVHVNRSFADFLGYTTHELEGKSFLEITHPDDAAASVEAMRKDPSMRPRIYEKRYVRRDGGIVWGRVTLSRLEFPNDRRSGFMAVIEDINERKLAGEVLGQQTEMLRGMLEHLPVMVVRLDAQGAVIYSNRKAKGVFNWPSTTASDIIALSFPDVEQQRRVRAMLAAGSAEWIDLEPRASNGRVVPSSWASITLSNGEALIIGQDLTERRQMQESLTRAQKLEALGQLAGGVAHDFNNLLTVIVAGATFVQDATQDRPSIQSDVQDILTAAARAAALTRQLLAFSRRQMLQPEVLNVNDAVQGLGKTMRRLLGEHIELDVSCDAEDANVEVDRNQLEQVILNLAVNARDAIKEHGTITITTQNAVDVRGRAELAILVRDDGSGIDPSVMHRIFEPFFTTKPLGKGTGLGLATVHGIVEQSGGRVTVDSTLGKGTTFSVYFPTVSAVPMPKRPSVELSAAGGEETILLVEDENAVRAITRRMLTSLGYNVIEARHGRDAMQLATQPGQHIDMLVTDVVMPEMGGRELAAGLRERTPGLPVLYISGYTDDELLRRGILEPGARLLRKPFAKKDIARAVRALLTGTAATVAEVVGQRREAPSAA